MINWNLLGNAPDPGQAFAAGLEHGRQQLRQTRQDNALSRLGQNPDDPQAQNALIALDPMRGAQAIQAIRQTQEMRRQEAIRQGEASAYDPASGQIDPAKLRQAHAANGDVAGAMQLDSQQQQQQLSHLEFAHKVNDYGLQLLGSVHDQASWDTARQQYAATLQRFNLPVPQLPEAYAPEVVRGLQEQSLSTKEQLEMHKGVVMGADSTLNDPFSGAELAHNQKPDTFQHVELRRGDGGSDGYTFNQRTGEWEVARAGGGSSGGGSAPTGVGVSPKAAEVASTLSAVLPAPVVAGFMGNFHVEGGYDGAQGDGGSASGIGQWHADRAAMFQRVIGTPVTQASPTQQAKFVLWEMQNPIAAGMTVAQRDKILAAKTAPEAAALIDQHYERSSGKDRQARMAAAAAFAGDVAPAAGGRGGGAPVRTPGKPVDDASGNLTGGALDIAAETWLKTGQMPQGLGRGGVTQRAIINRAAELAHGTPTDEIIGDRASRKADTAALQHLQTTSAQVLSFERTAQMNGHLALSLAGKANVGNTPLFNRWVNAGRKEVSGDPDISAFNAAVETFANEYARITASATGGGVTSDSAREHVHAMINSAQAPAQFRAVMSTLFKDMENRRVGLEQEREQILGRIRGGNASAPSGDIPTFTPEQARAAAPGTLFRTTDGRTMRKH